jgi:phage FluMu protein Com
LIKTMTLIRCARCGRVLGDFYMTEGEIRIRCVRSGCKKENVVRIGGKIEGAEYVEEWN